MPPWNAGFPCVSLCTPATPFSSLEEAHFWDRKAYNGDEPVPCSPAVYCVQMLLIWTSKTWKKTWIFCFYDCSAGRFISTKNAQSSLPLSAFFMSILYIPPRWCWATWHSNTIFLFQTQKSLVSPQNLEMMLVLIAQSGTIKLFKEVKVLCFNYPLYT